MKMKKYLACLLAAAMMCGAAAACGGSSTDSTEPTDAPTEAATEAPTEEETADEETAEEADGEEVVADVTIEPAISAEPGQAYLAIVDGQWWIQYWGDAMDDRGYMLSYDAGVADIQGNGQYTVSVNADTNGFRMDTTGDPTDQYIPNGLQFLAVLVPQGEELYPGMVMTIDKITVDGKEIAMSAKNYTSSDDGVETRTNIYNQWASAPSQDARTVEGALYDEDGNANDLCSEYSPQLIDLSDFGSWMNVEVTFTVSGLDGDAAAAADDANADADADADDADADDADVAEDETAAEAEE